jgi:arsenate reductase (thioredoxin)
MTKTVLFLCPHGAAKSVLAAAAFQRLADQRGLPLRALCAGTEPDATIAPAVVALLARAGLALPAERPQLVSAAQIAAAQRVVSLGCTREELPQQPAQWEQWDDVPAPSQDLAGAYARIQQHVTQLVEELGQS